MVDNNYTDKVQLSNGIWVVPDGNKSWGGELNYNFERLNDLLNTYTLTIKQNGVTVATFDRSADVTANIDTVYPTNDQIDILFPDYQGSQITPTVPNEKTEVNYSSLIRYNNNLKPLVVTDVSLSDNTMTFKYLDNNTKDIELPESQGASLPSKSVTRVPVYFKINFYIIDGNDEKDKINLSANDVKDIVKVYRKVSGVTFPVPVINVSTIPEESNDTDSVFRVAVNITPKDLHTFGGDIILLLGDSFGNLTIQSDKIKDAMNEAIDRYNPNAGESLEHVDTNTFTGQVLASFINQVDIHSQSIDSKDNVFIIDAVIRAYDMNFDGSHNKNLLSNSTFCWAKDEDVVSFSFAAKLNEVGEQNTTPETFTTYDL